MGLVESKTACIDKASTRSKLSGPLEPTSFDSAAAELLDQIYKDNWFGREESSPSLHLESNLEIAQDADEPLGPSGVLSALTGEGKKCSHCPIERSRLPLLRSLSEPDIASADAPLLGPWQQQVVADKLQKLAVQQLPLGKNQESENDNDLRLYARMRVMVQWDMLEKQNQQRASIQ